MPSNVRGANSYQFPNVNGEDVEFCEWISNCITQFVMDMIIYHDVSGHCAWQAAAMCSAWTELPQAPFKE